MHDTVAILDHDSDAERAVLGAVLIDNNKFPEVSRIIGPQDLHSRRHRIIFRGIAALRASGTPADLVTLKTWLERNKALVEAGGPAYLADLTGGVGRSVNVEHYAMIVQRLAWSRRLHLSAQSVVTAIETGEQDARVIELAEDVTEAATGGPRRVPDAVDLFGEMVQPTRPSFIVPNLIRQEGLHLVWAQPGGWKTTLIGRAVLDLISDPPSTRLWDHPDLPVYGAWKRVLWIATEESAETLRFCMDGTRRGMGNPDLAGEVRYIFAAGRPRITLDDLPAIVETEGPFDAVVLDSLTGLRPKIVGGRWVHHDKDNDAANELCLALRGLVAEHGLAVMMIHHSDKTVSNYRGPTDWWASADVMMGLLCDDGAVRVKHQKTRGGRLVKPFRLLPEWDGDAFTVEYDGEAQSQHLGPTAKKVREFVETMGSVSKARIKDTVPGAYSTVTTAIKECISAGVLRETGEKDGCSPIVEGVSEGVGRWRVTETPNPCGFSYRVSEGVGWCRFS